MADLRAELNWKNVHVSKWQMTRTVATCHLGVLVVDCDLAHATHNNVAWRWFDFEGQLQFKREFKGLREQAILEIEWMLARILKGESEAINLIPIVDYEDEITVYQTDGKPVHYKMCGENRVSVRYGDVVTLDGETT